MSFSLVEFYGNVDKNLCGYCKQSNSSHSHGMWTHNLSCQDYQDLIDRGWRRSGCYCYKPVMDVTCCPLYTIKCDAPNFRLNKSHKKIIKRVHKFLRDGIKDPPSEKTEPSNHEDVPFHEKMPNVQPASVDLSDIVSSLITPTREADQAESSKTKPRVVELPKTAGAVKVPARSAESDNCSLPKKAKQMRIERKRAKLQKKGVSGAELDRLMQPNSRATNEKTLEEFLSEAPQPDEPAAHRLKVKQVLSSDGATVTSFKLYTKYQQIIHKDPPSKLNMDRYKRFLCKSPLKIVTLLTSSDKFRESLHTSYALYEKYQNIIHNDPPGGIANYLDFLVTSPLQETQGFGSFHQQYWLDDRLIAVGVIDVLPYCVSSVYFFYDPEFKFLSLGTYGSLRELEFTRSLQKKTPSIESYYMGFYIHSCPKMRYKSNLQPSYLLCPEAYTWHLLDVKVLAKLDAQKYNRLDEDLTARDANKPSEQDLNEVLLLVGRNIMPYSQYLAKYRKKKPMVLEYASLVGKSCAKKMLLYAM